MNFPDTIPVAIVSRNTLAREGMRRILHGETFDVVHSIKSSESLAKSSGDDQPRIVVVDESDGYSLITEIEHIREQCGSARIVVLSSEYDFEAMVEAFRAGVDGYIVKSIDCDPLIESLKLVEMGQKVMPSELATRFPQHWVDENCILNSQRELLDLLSDREVETLRYLVVGWSNKLIARRLDISEATVKVHVKAILRKLDVQNRTQAAIWAVRHGINAQTPKQSIERVSSEECMVAL